LKYILVLFVVLIVGSVSFSAFSQVERGGVPRSFQFQQIQKSQLQPIEVAAPDMLSIQKEDYEDSRLEKSYRIGVEVPISISTSNSGQWDYIPGGGRIWRVTLSCNGAQAIGLNYNELRLPEGSDVFVYTPDQKYVIGAFTSAEVPRYQKFTTRPLSGDAIVLEYYEPAQVEEQAKIDIAGLVYIYRGFETQSTNDIKSVSSGSCEVNVNCEEGQNWQNQKQGGVKILTKVGGKYFFCSGTLMNNTSQDFSGLLLSAAHCSKDFNGGVATDLDYLQWIFYFNYEYSGCTPSTTTNSSVVGAVKLATSETPSDIGSDFLLLKTLNSIPAQYNAFYCGWDAGNGNSSSGVCIHHPDGDVKKISTYTTILGSGTWGSTPNTHWLVHFSQTKNGWGVTEGGSSGGPLFDDEGLVIGTLTGGQSSCTNPDGEDMFGKFSYSWESNGTTKDLQLKPWLDSLNTGITKMPGSFNDKLTVADFSANTYMIPVGGTVDFQDLSAGKPNKWHWYFQSGEPSESTDQNPSGILFDRFGLMNVKLVVSNEYNTDSIVKEGFVDVRFVISPNPCTGVVSILTDKNVESTTNIEVFDSQGKIAQRFEYSGAVAESYSIKLPGSGNLFIIRILQGNQVQVHKVVVIR
jgi:PKD repeat protein